MRILLFSVPREIVQHVRRVFDGKSPFEDEAGDVQRAGMSIDNAAAKRCRKEVNVRDTCRELTERMERFRRCVPSCPDKLIWGSSSYCVP